MTRILRTKDKIIGGVCGGIAKFLNETEKDANEDSVIIEVDPTWIRLGWTFLTLLSVGTGILVYIICWMIIPEEK